MLLQLRLRHTLRVVHRYLGLGIGAVLSLVCLTGSLIVYKPSWEKLAIPQLAYVEPADRGPLSLDSLYRAVNQRYPKHQIENLVLYGDADEAYSFRCKLRGQSGRRQVYINQYTGQVLGEDVYKHKFLQLVYDLHTKLLMGKLGLTLLGVLTCLFVLLLLSGLFILPPRLYRLLRSKQRNSYMRYYKLHIAIGLVTILPLLVIAFTGAYWAFPELYRKGFERIGEGKAIAERPRYEPSGEAPWIELDFVLAQAQRAFPEGKATILFFPKKEGDPFSVRMRSHQDYARTGSHHIYIHPTSGEVLGRNLWHSKPLPERLTRAMYFIHFGEFAGHWSRILWLLIGLCPMLLYATGLHLYYKRRSK